MSPAVTTITLRWQGDPAALDAALAYMAEAVAVRAGIPTPTGRLALAILDAARGDTVYDLIDGPPVALPDGLGVARASAGGDGAA